MGIVWPGTMVPSMLGTSTCVSGSLIQMKVPSRRTCPAEVAVANLSRSASPAGPPESVSSNSAPMRMVSIRSNSRPMCSVARTATPATKWLANRIGDEPGRCAPATTSGAMSTRPLEMLRYGTRCCCAKRSPVSWLSHSVATTAM
jgi:hypothetical protein